LKKNSKGFTLIELLVVMVIVGILFSFAALSLNSRPSPAKLAAYKVQQLLKLASDDAILRGQIMGWHLSDSAHNFLRYKQQKWQALKNDNLLRRTQINQVLEYHLNIDDLPVVLNPKLEPQVIFMPDGSFSHFSLSIQLQDSEEIYTVYSEANKILLSIKNSNAY
jgi:general secretion pathway protein H